MLNHARRNPFFLGTFEGERVRQVRALRRVAIALSCLTAVAAGMAVRAYVGTEYSACQILITDIAGSEYVAGEGESQAEAAQGFALPRDGQAIRWHGCGR